MHRHAESPCAAMRMGLGWACAAFADTLFEESLFLWVLTSVRHMLGWLN